MEEALALYVSALLPELDRTLLAPETASRLADYRQDIQESWGSLDPGQRESVASADRALIAAAPLVARYWAEPGIVWVREKYQPPKKAWWWWLHEIAQGAYPAEMLPE